MKKSEIKQIIKEVITEGWLDFINRPMLGGRYLPERKPGTKFYKNVHKWFKDMLDSNGRYIGPKLPGFEYTFDDIYTFKYIKTLPENEMPRADALRIVMKWNRAFAAAHSLSRERAAQINKFLQQDYYEKFGAVIASGDPAYYSGAN